jgi:hypothetical protein
MYINNKKSYPRATPNFARCHFIFMLNANLPRMVCNMWYIEKQQVQRIQPCKTTFAIQTQIFVLRPETLQYVTDVYAF